ncbi:hypothetical protein L1787_13390 [Acuticoccus sp. M5D2P5]|uniref:hypothetical protein n=1 Tax=Acuticoccus kalidii TaxID=2910977 RepID=UPI001F47425E|nr:hypothetical protein [Acuticoccus kalidii]MCF3934398.1 hypothetical protein [Acuticoccus kalidii]
MLDPDVPGVGVNRYAYAGNEPINNLDPNGEETKVAVKAYSLNSYPLVGGEYGHAHVEYRDTETGEARITPAGPSRGVNVPLAISGMDARGYVVASDPPADSSIDFGRSGTITVTKTVTFDTIREVEGRIKPFNIRSQSE